MTYQKNAFTLVEMLIAIILISMLIAMSVFSFKHMLINFKKMRSQNFDSLLSFHQLKSSISAMSYYVVDDYDQFDRPQN
ncbi:MAG: type II secretion system protein, partial [Campylobacterota bacterium]|nr:type II secretion system protein [Campylobacterota bacterium]